MTTAIYGPSDPADTTRTVRLARQLQTVLDVMRDEQWRTLAAIASEAHAPEASISARLRDLRNQHHYRVERRHVVNGLYQYRVLPPEPWLESGRLF